MEWCLHLIRPGNRGWRAKKEEEGCNRAAWQLKQKRATCSLKSANESAKCSLLRSLRSSPCQPRCICMYDSIHVWWYLLDKCQYTYDMLCSLHRCWCCVVTPPRAVRQLRCIHGYVYIHNRCQDVHDEHSWLQQTCWPRSCTSLRS